MYILQVHYGNLLATGNQNKKHTKTAFSSRVVVQYFNRKTSQFYKGYFLTLPDESIEN